MSQPNNYPKIHEVYFTERKYNDIIDDYQSKKGDGYDSADMLQVAKAYFIQEKYELTMKVLSVVNPEINTKVLFERQSLMFRAAYLLQRQVFPSVKLIETLGKILNDFNRLKLKTRGQSITQRHLKRMAEYGKFLEFVLKDKLRENSKKAFKTEKNQQFRKFQGFPCYLISEQWHKNFKNREKISQQQPSYIGPVTNFSIINDIFQMFTFDSPLHSYKNDLIFPGQKYQVISKRQWKQLNNFFNPSYQFIPIKRLCKQRQGFSYKYNNQFHDLVPLAIQCEGETVVIQITANGQIQKELFQALSIKWGLGQLAKFNQDSKDYQLLDLEVPIQKNLIDIGSALRYILVKGDIKIGKNMLYPLLKYNITVLPKQLMKREQGGLKGLQNLGNSCYMNSCIQCLSFTKEIVVNLTTQNLLDRINKNSDGTIVCSISDVFKSLWARNSAISISPSKFKRQFGVKNTMFSEKTQQDAHQFLLQLLNDIHSDLKISNDRVMKSISKLDITTDQFKVKQYFRKHELDQNISIITKEIRGIMHNKIQCGNCNTSSHSYDVFLALSLPIPQKIDETLSIYFIKYNAKNTHKYEINLSGIITVDDVLKTLQQNDCFTDGGVGFVYEFLCLSRKTLRIRKQIGERGFGSTLSKQITVEQLLKESKVNQYILYQIKYKSQNQEQLVLIQYQYKNQVLGFPRLAYVMPVDMKSGLTTQFKQFVVNTDKQNYFKVSDIKEIKRYNVKEFLFPYNIVVQFKTKQKIFGGSGYIDKEINSKADSYDLTDCFNLMKAPETIQNSWTCGKCQSKKSGEKREEIVETNNILIISLKRFKADSRKIKSMIKYPITDLDITQWIQQSNLARQKYDLYAVCLHQGTMQFGHYRAYCKHFETGKWYQFDDRQVKNIQQSDVVNQNAYLLFYRRRQI